MKRAAVLSAAAVTLILLSAAVVHAEGQTTLTGEFVWEGGGSDGDLEGVFTPTKTEGQWNVAFHFEFRGKPHTYEGTAEGSLKSGRLSGTVQNEKKRRTFTFEGTIDDGQFSGTHAEINGERSSRTGTLTLGTGPEDRTGR